MFRNKFFQIGFGIIVILLIIYLGSLVSWLFKPIIVFAQTLFVPLLLAGVLYYLFRPLVQILNKKMPRTIAILLLYVVFTAFLIGIFSIVVPEVKKQFSSLIVNLPVIIWEVQRLIVQLQSSELIENLNLQDMINIDEYVVQLGGMVNNFLRGIVTNVFGFIGTIVSTLVILFAVPFLLFYMLKEGGKFSEHILRLFRQEKREEVRLIFLDMDAMLSSYIKGIMIVSLFVGVLCYLAFTIIGLDYALILALVAMVTNVIPYVGPWIGTVPAVIVGLIHSPFKAVLVVLLVFIIQQIESSVLQPQVMGRKLAMHPVTVLSLILVAGGFAGIIGMLLAVPTYAVGKVIVTHVYRLWKLSR